MEVDGSNNSKTQFIYKKEFWLMSAFINSDEINMASKIIEIKEILLKKLKKNILQK